MMKTRYLLFTVGVVGLLMSYVLLGSAQYFSAPFMLLLLFIAFASIVLLGLGYLEGIGQGAARTVGVPLSLAVAFSVLAEAAFVIYNSVGGGSTLSSVLGEAVAASATPIALTALTVAAAYVIGKRTSYLHGREALLVIAACILFASAIIGQIEYYALSSHSRLIGTDELALGYHAAQAFSEGYNPYRVNYQPNLARDNITPTFFLNGTCQCYYSYPALSIFAIMPLMAAAGSYGNFLPLALVAVAAAVISALVLLFRLGADAAGQLVLPASAISFTVFAVAQWPLVKYITMLVLMLAFVYRKRPLMYPVLLGCAASLHQVGMIAVPFFVLLTADEGGWKRASRTAGIAFAVFLAFNAYFLYLTGTSMVAHVVEAGSNWLVPRGVTVMQFMLAFFPVQYNYSALFFLLLYGELLAAFYLFRGARFVMCVMAPLVFMLSTSNSITYAVPFMPLLLLMTAERRPGSMARGRKNAIPTIGVAVGIISFVAFFCAVTAYSHSAYTSAAPIWISNATGILQGVPGGNIRITEVLVDVCVTSGLTGGIVTNVHGIRPLQESLGVMVLLSPQAAGSCSTYFDYHMNWDYSPATKLLVQVSSGRYLSVMRRVNLVYYTNASAQNP